MLVYRIETAQGVGAFQAGLTHAHDRAVRVHTYRSCYDGPSPEASGLPRAPYDGSSRFGCHSLEQLRASWFFDPKGCAAMAAQGGFLSTYEVDDAAVQTGSQQLVFDIRRAKLVERVPACALHQIAEA